MMKQKMVTITSLQSASSLNSCCTCEVQTVRLCSGSNLPATYPCCCCVVAVVVVDRTKQPACLSPSDPHRMVNRTEADSLAAQIFTARRRQVCRSKRRNSKNEGHHHQWTESRFLDWMIFLFPFFALPSVVILLRYLYL